MVAEILSFIMPPQPCETVYIRKIEGLKNDKSKWIANPSGLEVMIQQFFQKLFKK